MANVLNIESVATKTTAASEPEAQRLGLWSRIVMHFRSKRQAVKIMKALNESEQIHSGKKRGKSFNEFLKEI